MLFLCTTNSCRSQMAEGILRQCYGDEFTVYSAGAKNTPIHPLAIKVMAKIGIDISQQKSKLISEFSSQEFDYVITLCGGNSKIMCPVFTGKAKERLNWNFPDPAEAKGSEDEVLLFFQKVRDEIKNKISEFVQELKWEVSNGQEQKGTDKRNN